MMALGFAMILVGVIVEISGITGSSLHSVVQGKPDHSKNETGGSGFSSSKPGSQGKQATTPAEAGSTRSIAEQEAKLLSARLKWNYADWVKIIERESGWNVNATNPETGAFGIGQLNPQSGTLQKYSQYGSETTNPVSQINSMARYIIERYGNPTKAWEHEEAYGWY